MSWVRLTNFPSDCFASLVFFFVEKPLPISDRYFPRSTHGFRHYMNLFRNSPSESFKMKTFILIATSRVNDSRIRILQDPAGKKRGNHRILQESTGNSRMWKQYSNRKIAGFFPVNSGQFPAGTGQKSSGSA